jgi:hypothetical protein
VAPSPMPMRHIALLRVPAAVALRSLLRISALITQRCRTMLVLCAHTLCAYMRNSGRIR